MLGDCTWDCHNNYNQDHSWIMDDTRVQMFQFLFTLVVSRQVEATDQSERIVALTLHLLLLKFIKGYTALQ